MLGIITISDKLFTYLSDNHDIISMKLYELESLKKVRILDSRAQRFMVYIILMVTSHLHVPVNVNYNVCVDCFQRTFIDTMYVCVLQEGDAAAYQGLPSAQFFASPRGLLQGFFNTCIFKILISEPKIIKDIMQN